MGEIKRTINIQGTKNSITAKALLDTGASRDYIRRDIAEKIGYKSFGKVPVKLADTTERDGESAEFVSIEIDGCKPIEPPRAVIMDKLAEEYIVGQRLMQDLGIELQMIGDKVVIKKYKPSAYLI